MGCLKQENLYEKQKPEAAISAAEWIYLKIKT